MAITAVYDSIGIKELPMLPFFLRRIVKVAVNTLSTGFYAPATENIYQTAVVVSPQVIIVIAQHVSPPFGNIHCWKFVPMRRLHNCDAGCYNNSYQ
ncbi:hypothetical protein [Thermincola potens]|uniref:hypothetical protein n=1 Tax=Thermincola potens TaxID=863643 RepID=UPI0012FE4B69|nr:hypothetical protein [Thermincola potens]